jgi:POT family proton-dependent oligopeptide transporter
VILTIAEILVSITMLEFAYTQAPKRMKSTIMGFAMFTITIGNTLVAMLAGVQKQMTTWVGENVVPGLSQAATFFWIFAVLCAVAAMIFGLRAYFYISKDYAQE